MKSLLKFVNILGIFFLCSSGKCTAQFFCQAADGPNFLQTISPLQTSSSTYCVNIFIHVMADDNSQGGVSLADVNSAIPFLRADYLPHGITFNILGYEVLSDYAWLHNTFLQRIIMVMESVIMLYLTRTQMLLTYIFIQIIWLHLQV